MASTEAVTTAMCASADGRPQIVTRRAHGLQVKRPNKDIPTPLTALSPPPVQHCRRVTLNNAMRYCLDFVKDMLSKKHREYAWPFYEPVSVQQYPDYRTRVKRPIDLTTIKMKIESGQYCKVKDFASDMRLMFTNCLRYNPEESPIAGQARQLREFFEYTYARIPEPLLEERMTVTSDSKSSHNKSHHENSVKQTQIDGDIHQTNIHKKAAKIVESARDSLSDENQERMRKLEDQVKLLMGAMSALTNGPKVSKNGAKRHKPSKKKRVRKSTQKSANNRAKRQRKTQMESEEEDEDYDESNVMPSPISFQYDDMEDLKQLKTDLENLNASDLKNVLRILQTTEPSIKCDNDENIEIDFEVLKPETLIALRKFVSSCMLNNIPKKHKSMNGSDSSRKRHKNGLNCDNVNTNTSRDALNESTSGHSALSPSFQSANLSDSDESDESDDNSE